jgi:hypothetical protein
VSRKPPGISRRDLIGMNPKERIFLARRHLVDKLQLVAGRLVPTIYIQPSRKGSVAK